MTRARILLADDHVPLLNGLDAGRQLRLKTTAELIQFAIEQGGMS